MNKIILAFAITAVLFWKDCAAEYDVKGDHFGTDEDVHIGDSRVHVTKYAQEIGAELEVLLQRRNASDIASKYAEDVVYVQQGHSIAFGREQVAKLYQDWFDTGVYGSDITTINAYMLGDDYMAIFGFFTPYDNNRLNVGITIALVILKRTENGDGFQTFLKSEIVNYWQ